MQTAWLLCCRDHVSPDWSLMLILRRVSVRTTIAGRFLAFFLLAASQSAFSDYSINYEDVEISQSEMSPGYVREGEEVLLKQLATMVPGVGEEEVRSRLGEPHAVTPGAEEVWEYHIRLPLALAGGGFVACQYGVVFGDNKRVASLDWRRAVCERLFSQWQEKYATPTHSSTLKPAAIFFDFDSVDLDDKYRRTLDEVASQVESDCCISAVNVAGYTDWAGSDAYNLELSLERALVVRNYLQEKKGLDATYHVEGYGEAASLNECKGKTSSVARHDCMQHSRRVEVSFDVK